jgi:hypothetical protein
MVSDWPATCSPDKEPTSRWLKKGSERKIINNCKFFPFVVSRVEDSEGVRAEMNRVEELLQLTEQEKNNGDAARSLRN